MNIRGNIWIKGLSFLLASLAGVWTLACLAVTLLMSFEPEMQGGREDYENFFYERALKVYGADFFSHNLWDETIRQEEIMEACEGFDGGNVKFTLIRENTDQTVSTLYSNDRTVGAEDYQAKLEHNCAWGYYYNLSSPMGLLRGYHRYHIYYDKQQEAPSYVLYLKVVDEPKENLTFPNGREDYLFGVKELADLCYSFGRNSGYLAGLGLMVFLACFVFLMSVSGYKKGEKEPKICALEHLPLGLYFFALVCVEGFLLALFGYIVFEVLFQTTIAAWLLLGAAGLVALIGVGLALAFCMSVAVRIKTKTLARYTICYYLFTPLEWVGRLAREKASLFVKLLAFYLLIFITEIIVIAAAEGDYYNLLSLFLLFKLLEFPLFCYLVRHLSKIKEGGARIATGDYSHPIDTAGMIGELKIHANHLNSVSEGMSSAVEARMKSERFRTELITNVSHDIKTPLTSIINYVDLIKKEQIDQPVIQEYVEVLDRQSARLKKLIEDLMEASKASTGNLSVNAEVLDASIVLSQVVGEFEERAEENELELIVEKPEGAVEIMADGKHLWRILDNLMSNICKYAMPKTRVYIKLESYNGMAIMTFRNISKAKLNMDSEELFERFVRGDSSRNTEGNGLGLNIAQSLTSLMDGNMAIQIDGDLFKVIVSFSQVNAF